MHELLMLCPTVCVRLELPARQRVHIAFGDGRTRQELACNAPLVVAWLLGLRTPTPVSTAIASARALLGLTQKDADQFVGHFRDIGVLIPESTVAPERQDALHRWIRWGWRDALDFHLATRDLAFECGDAEGFDRQLAAMHDWIEASRQGQDEASPGPFQTYADRPKVPLTRSRRGVDARAFGDVLYARRTTREFDGRQIASHAFAEVIEHTFAMTGLLDGGGLGDHVIRTSPSGGARHPIEVYPVVVHVEGLQPGIYHYAVQDHTLELLRAGVFSNEIWELAHRQRGMYNVSAALFYTVRWARHMWKYRYARSYRMVLFDVAHLVQTQLLVATALGLRTFLTPAVRDTAAGGFLGLEDDLVEAVLYVTGIG